MKRCAHDSTGRSVLRSGALMAVAGLSAAAWLIAAAPAAADPYPWCAQYGRDGGRNCGFLTLQQCLDTVSGVGGGCERNLFYTGPERAQHSKQRTTRPRRDDRLRER